MKFSVSNGDLLEYNGNQGANELGYTAKIKLGVLESTTNATITYMLIQSFIKQLPLIVTQYLFHSSATTDHAQMRPKDAIILQFCVAMAM